MTTDAAVHALARTSLIDVENLTVTYRSAHSTAVAVAGVSFSVAAGERCGLVGESGSGKSTVVKALLGLVRPPHLVEAARLDLDGVGDLRALSPRQLRAVKGVEIGYVGQNPFGSLHPVIRIRKQFETFLKAHGHKLGRAEARDLLVRTLSGLGIADSGRVLDGFAGELSGGMAQRVAIAFASILEPRLLVADEPTTALDVTVQRQVLDLIASRQDGSDRSLLLVTHDLSVVAQYCDSVVVMRHGRVLEAGTVADVFSSPEHPYTASLLNAVLSLESRKLAGWRGAVTNGASAPEPLGYPAAGPQAGPEADAEGADEPVLRLVGVHKIFRSGQRVVHAVNGVSLEVRRTETVAVVGESGSGKSTVGRIALALIAPNNGAVRLEGRDLVGLKTKALRDLRCRMQIVFQDPFQSLDPQLQARQSVAEPLTYLRPRLGRAEIERRADEALELVGLSEAKRLRYPRQLSGGEQQRVGIARAIVTRPALVVLDEPTSSLDLSIRAEIIALLEKMQAELGMAYLFISHDLRTVEHLANWTCVMYRGQVVEYGPGDQVLSHPLHPYTEILRAARLDLDPSAPLLPMEPPPPPLEPAADERACGFIDRCARRSDDCRIAPELLAFGATRRVACWHPGEAGSS